MRYALLILTLFTAAILGSAFLGAGRQDGTFSAALAAEKVAGLDEFMVFVHGQKGALKQIKESVEGAGPADDKAWKSVRAQTSILSFLSTSILEKSTPPKGDKAAWKTKVTDYSKVVKALSKAADGKDPAAMRAEISKLDKSCEACHKAHR